MYEILKKQFSQDMSSEEKINYVREYLQILILKIMYERGMFRNLAFVGGTALRILYGLKRFSEDIDLSLINKRNYNFNKFISNVLYDLKHLALELDIKLERRKIVQGAMIKFKKILPILNLSSIKEQKLSVKIEIDTNPPKGWNTELSLVNKNHVFTVTHFDIPSLYATKLHCCFFRKYVKGRDFYDLVWYLGKRILPNFVLLNNAIKQTEKKSLGINQENFKNFLVNKLALIDFKKVKKDVERFLEDKSELRLLDKELLIRQVLKD